MACSSGYVPKRMSLKEYTQGFNSFTQRDNGGYSIFDFGQTKLSSTPCWKQKWLCHPKTLDCVSYHCLSVCSFSFGHCGVCPSSIYCYWLSICRPLYLQMDVVEWSRALDVRLSEWCFSVTMVWVQIPSREEQKFDRSKI